VKVWLQRHFQVLSETLVWLVRSPGSTLTTALILGVAISLPLMLFKVTQSMMSVTGKLNGDSVITVFVSPPEPEQAGPMEEDQMIIEIGHGILQIPRVRDVEYISRDQVLEDFRNESGLGDLIDDLEDNPLPAMLIVFPEKSLPTAELSELARVLADLEGVDSVSYDRQWQERLQAIINVFMSGALILASLMAIGVVLIISNTVRLGILNRSQEIQIIDQIGGTATFIRRPFLYFGTLQGISGAIVALLITVIALTLLARPVNHLAGLYSSEFRIDLLDLEICGLVMVVSAVLGWMAARFTVGGYIRKMRASARGK
jgi:cell division transport system permease protein